MDPDALIVMDRAAERLATALFYRRYTFGIYAYYEYRMRELTNLMCYAFAKSILWCGAVSESGPLEDSDALPQISQSYTTKLCRAGPNFNILRCIGYVSVGVIQWVNLQPAARMRAPISF